MFPGRTQVPKTLIFAKDDSHADDVVQIVREEFGKGNEFATKITYRTNDGKPEELLANFRNSYDPRIVVTVDMIATGTDVKPIEIVMFMRSVKSRIYFEQMIGRGARVINRTDLETVTPDAGAKTHFVIVDAVGVTETNLIDSRPLERQPTTPLKKLLQNVSAGMATVEDVSSLAGRLARLNRQITKDDRERIGGGARSEPPVDHLDAGRRHRPGSTPRSCCRSCRWTTSRASSTSPRRSVNW